MGNLKNLLGYLLPGTGRADTRPRPSPPRMLPGCAMPELCMLATDASIPTERGAEIVREHGRPGKRIVQVKADGIRALYIEGRIVTREGMPLDCALHCQPGLARLEKYLGQPMVFDGEYVAHDGFNATLTEMKKGEGDGVFWIFDIMSLEEWMSGGSADPVERRLARLSAVYQHAESSFVGMLDYWELTAEETWAKAREIWAVGGEGIVSKAKGSPYVRDRSDHWLKVKHTHTVDGIIVDMMARKDGTLKNMTVRVEAGRKGDEIPQTVIVAGGWTKEEGKSFLAAWATSGGSIEHNMRLATGERDCPPLWAEINFQMTTGVKRTVRGAKFIRLRAAKAVRP